MTGFAFQDHYGSILLTWNTPADTANIVCYAISFLGENGTWTEYESGTGNTECFFRGVGLNGHSSKIKITSIANPSSGLEDGVYIADCDVTVNAKTAAPLDSVTFTDSGRTNAAGKKVIPAWFPV